MRFLSKPRSIDDILADAHAELATNPTITVYKMVKGVERRRAAMPFAGAAASPYFWIALRTPGFGG